MLFVSVEFHGSRPDLGREWLHSCHVLWEMSEVWTMLYHPSSGLRAHRERQRHEEYPRTGDIFSKVEGYKINTQRSVAFLHTKDKDSERKSRKQIHSQEGEKKPATTLGIKLRLWKISTKKTLKHEEIETVPTHGLAGLTWWKWPCYGSHQQI